MPSFGERLGFVPPRGLQIDSLDKDARTALWSVFYTLMSTSGPNDELSQSALTLVVPVWMKVMKRPIHTTPRYKPHVVHELYPFFYDAHWVVLMELVEECGVRTGPEVRQHFNRALERESVAYRFVDELLVPLTNKEEIAEVEQVLTSTVAGLAGGRAHIAAALKKLTERPTPDVRNSIKESISAVEAVARVIASEGNTLGAALKRLDADMDPALRGGLDKLYGWTCNEDGIRHALMDEPKAAVEEARFMLVACSAFVNYLVVKADKKGITL